MALKLLSVNIERSRHLDRVLPLVQKYDPDVLCIQELAEKDIDRIREAYSHDYEFAPMLRHFKYEDTPIVGIGIFSKLPVIQKRSAYYYGSREALPDHNETPSRGDDMNCAVALMTVTKDSMEFKVGTTHFTWSDGGQATDLQRENMNKLIATMEQEGEMVLSGDFNAPRGREIFGMIASRFKDNIPPEYTTSIEGSLHRAGDLQLMVDGLFTTPAYTASNVRLIGGISDHMAIVADIGKAQ